MVQLVTQTKPQVRRDRLLRLEEVEGIAGIKKTTIAVLEKRGDFPARIPITQRAVRWYESDVLQWVQDRRGKPLPSTDSPSAEVSA